MLKTKFLTLLLLSSTLVSSCEVHPLYGKPSGQKGACNNFEVDVIDIDSAGQRLKYKLQDLLNYACIKPDTKFKVGLNLTKTKQSLSVQKNRAITRFNMIFTAAYNVLDSDTNTKFYSGKSTATGAFDAQTSFYGTYSIEQDTNLKLAEELAREISLKIGAKINEAYSK
jgi:hypothetical protein